MKEIRQFLGIEKDAGIGDGQVLALEGGAKKGFPQVRQFQIDAALFIAELIRIASRAMSFLRGWRGLMHHIMDGVAAGVGVAETDGEKICIAHYSDA